MAMTVTVRWLGHAGFQIKAGGKVVYVDYYRPKKLIEKVPDVSEQATLILVTHSHNDHCFPEAISSVRTSKTTVVAPEDCWKDIGGTVTALKPGEEIAVQGIKVRAVEAYNLKRFRSPGNPYHPKGFGVGYVVTIDGKTVYHAGDTDLIPEMRKVGRVDVALLPCGDKYTMDNVEAAEAALVIKPRMAVPMHNWDKGTDEFKKRVGSGAGIRVMTLQEGEEFSVE